MGTQQVLLIVLGVIIVGISVVVGIVMFNNAAYNSNKQELTSELTTYASNVIQWWKTPSTQGGAGQRISNLILANTAVYLGFTEPSNSLTNGDVGEFRIIQASSADTTVVLVGLGKETKKGLHPKATTTIKLIDCSINTVLAEAADFD